MSELKLTNEFISQYENLPSPFNQLGEFVYYRTYSRWLPGAGRRETAIETFRRAVEYNCSLAPTPVEEARKLFDNMFNLRQFLSGRTLWVGGTDISKYYPMANFNCSFQVIDTTDFEVFENAFYLLMLGCGFGHRELPRDVANLPTVRTDVKIAHKEYVPHRKEDRLERTESWIQDDALIIRVGDSKEGWVEALSVYLNALREGAVDVIIFDYDSVRPKGERLKRFGGTASGPSSLRDMFEAIHIVIRAMPFGTFRPVDALDIMNIIGENVVVGGVRRTSEIGLGDALDGNWVFAKYGINGRWTEEQEKAHEDAKRIMPNLPDAFPEGKQYRRMSNNSVFYETKPTRDLFHSQFVLLKNEGEPCFLNAEAARKRRPNFEGVNPCVEILLDSRGLCNLTTTVVSAFIYLGADGKYHLDLEGLLEAHRLSARAGYRMTCIDLELPKWDEINKRDRLCGVSLTGWQDAMGALEYTEEQEIELLKKLHEAARKAVDDYADELGTPRSLLVTCVKPEGTLSLVAGGVSPGLHYSHSEYHIRRIRINANDPLAKTAMALGWVVNPEVGQNWENARTLVIDFPVHVTAKKTKYDATAIEQLETYKRFQTYYTEHNTSNTITVKDEEWDEVEQWLWDNWDEVVAVSFLKLDGHTYDLAPYETITKEKYEELSSVMKPFSTEALYRFEKSETEFDGGEACDTGACPVR